MGKRENNHAFGNVTGRNPALVLIFILFCHGVGGRAVKSQNRVAIKTIKTDYGDILDCVDIYKQPAFDNPLLRNHTIQLRPSFEPKETTSVPSSNTEDPPTVTAEFWPMSESCPDGTVPILRVSPKKNSLRVPTLINYPNENLNGVDPREMAGAEIVGDNQLHGTRAQINVWNPTVATKNDYSTSQLWIMNSTVDPLNSIEAGWIVHPSLFGDNLTRIFIRWSKNARGEEGCINHQCPGFVQTSQKYPLGIAINPVSIYEGKQVYIPVHVYQDPQNGNWWVQCLDVVLGYWPRSLLDGLAISADSIGWGGSVYNSAPDPKTQIGTQMGSGHLPHEGYGKASFISNIKIVDDSYSLAEPTDISLIGGKAGYYEVRIRGNQGSAMQFHLFYGGPGKT